MGMCGFDDMFGEWRWWLIVVFILVGFGVGELVVDKLFVEVGLDYVGLVVVGRLVL